MPYYELLDEVETPRTIAALAEYGCLDVLDDDVSWTKVVVFLRGIEVTLRDARPEQRGDLFRLLISDVPDLYQRGVRRGELVDTVRQIVWRWWDEIAFDELADIR